MLEKCFKTLVIGVCCAGIALVGFIIYVELNQARKIKNHNKRLEELLTFTTNKQQVIRDLGNPYGIFSITNPSAPFLRGFDGTRIPPGIEANQYLMYQVEDMVYMIFIDSNQNVSGYKIVNN